MIFGAFPSSQELLAYLLIAIAGLLFFLGLPLLLIGIAAWPRESGRGLVIAGGAILGLTAVVLGWAHYLRFRG